MTRTEYIIDDDFLDDETKMSAGSQGFLWGLIRCKDCKYYEEQDETIGTCLLTESGAHIKGYCAWAERKEE